jgi:hypothetical protein
MANEIRRRYNFQSGTNTNAVLLVGATTLTSASLVGFPAIGSTEYAALVLDPAGAGNGPEIVYVTAHTASANNATIVRGREGTSAVQHSAGVIWIHVATANDYPVVGDNNDQPSTGGLPYEGQMYVDTTNDQLEIYNGSAWVPVDYGVWTAFTPTLGGTSAALGNGQLTCHYTQIGKTIHARYILVGGSTTNLSSDRLTLTLPVTARDPGDYRVAVGSGHILDNGVASYTIIPIIDHQTDTGNNKIFFAYGSTTLGSVNDNTPISGFSTFDTLSATITYEAA